ncbi:hypothetical protein KW850_08115 [Bacillus sp. sid0103]|uniref:hypothetical protein n=1 Tax=Bacillus sp. sid0103 TaxID=2856337 RepID=UPI001C47F3FC|nr:hypothetical protein [Bacillus sp. sid0103]MBV7505219.1 hypothetical protein [Bacillus sp. sid0103]
MIKRAVILLVLSSILVTLVWVRHQSTAPVNNTSTERHVSSKYTTVEYKISKIKGKKYYGKGEDGEEIVFSAENIVSGENIQVDDVVICYFEKHNLGKGLVKVEEK